MNETHLGPNCRVIPVEGDGEVCLKVEVSFDLGWHAATRPPATVFPGTAVSYEDEWYEVIRCEPGAEGNVMFRTYGLRRWDGPELMRHTFRLNEASLQAAMAERWQSLRQPFSAKKAALALLPTFALIALVVGNSLLAVAALAWLKAQMDAGQLSPMSGRLISYTVIVLAVFALLGQFKVLSRWLSGVNRPFPWTQTEPWHARNGLVVLSILGVLLGVGLLWLGAGDWRLLGGCLIAAIGVAWVFPDPPGCRR